eukprot:c20549_g1_i1 orf=247-1266(+)
MASVHTSGLEEEKPAVTVNFWGNMSETEYYDSQRLKHQTEYFKTPYGTLFTQSWLHKNAELKGVVCCTHGYGSDSGWMFQKIPMAFAQWGYGSFAADMLGHGRSDGLHGYIEDVEMVAAASLNFYQSVRDREEFKGLPKYLFGESMGGGATFLMLLQDPEGWDGALFSAPLFIMPNPMRPSKWRLTAYGLFGGLAETWAVMPRENMVGKAVKDPAKGKIIASNPRRYTGSPRVGTMRQLSRLCDIFSKRCDEITVPFLVVHGTADYLTAPEGSQILYDRSKSRDKTIKLYDGMYHSLIQGETDENCDRVLFDMREWLEERSKKPEQPDRTAAEASRLEE